MSDPIARLNKALEGRYRIERELGEEGDKVAVRWVARGTHHGVLTVIRERGPLPERVENSDGL